MARVEDEESKEDTALEQVETKEGEELQPEQRLKNALQSHCKVETEQRVGATTEVEAEECIEAAAQEEASD